MTKTAARKQEIRSKNAEVKAEPTSAFRILTSAFKITSVLQNHLRNRLLGGVRNRKRGVLHSEPRSEFRRDAVKRNRRPPSRHARDFAIPPAHSMIPPRAQRLHRRFFRGKASGVALHAICLRIAVTHFSCSVDAVQKPVAEPVNRPLNARNLS